MLAGILHLRSIAIQGQLIPYHFTLLCTHFWNTQVHILLQHSLTCVTQYSIVTLPSA